MPKTGSETTADKQTVTKKGRHVNNKIPQFENFFKGILQAVPKMMGRALFGV